MKARGDVQLALRIISQNPAVSLSVLTDPARQPPVSGLDSNAPPLEEQKVLAERRGSTLTARTILKSYHSAQLVMGQRTSLPGIPDIRQVPGMAVFTVGALVQILICPLKVGQSNRRFNICTPTAVPLEGGRERL